MKRINQTSLLFLALTCVAGAAITQTGESLSSETGAPSEPTPSEQEVPSELDMEVTVTSRLPEPSALDFEREELEERSPGDLAEALRGTSGIEAVRRGAINLDPTVRGLQEGQLAVTVDGTRTFAAGPARMDSDLSHISLHAIERVAVVKGPYALTWGAGALSAIDVRTRRVGFGDFEIQAVSGLSIESNTEAIDGYFWLGDGSDRTQWNLLGNYREGADYEDGDGVEIPSDYSSIDTRGLVGWRPSEQHALHLSGGYQAQDDIDYAGRLLDATYFRTRSVALGYDFQSSGGGAFSGLSAQAYSNRKDHLMNNDEKPTGQDMPGRVPPFALDIGLPTESNTGGARLHARFETGDWSFLVGGDTYLSEKRAERFVRRRSNGVLIFQDTVWPDAEIRDTGVFAQAFSRLARAEFGGTVRFDSVRASADPSAFYRANVSGEVDQSEDNWSGSFSARFEVADGWVLDAGVGRAVRTASVLERYSDRFPATKFQLAAEFLGNPELDPEASLEADVGLSATLGSVLLRVEGFYRTIDDYITVVADPSVSKRLPLSPPTVFRYINGDRAAFHGGELSIDQRVSAVLRWFARASWIRGTDEELDEPVLGMPADHVALGLRLHNRPESMWLQLEASATADQERVALTRGERESEGYELVHLRFGWQASSAWQVNAAVENLADEAYANHLNAPNPFTRARINEAGRTIRLGVRWNL